MPGAYFHRQYFNPRSPWGERHSDLRKKQRKKKFQSTLPVGGATTVESEWNIVTDISIHAPRGGSDDILCSTKPIFKISIHAPRGGSDFPGGDPRSPQLGISIHAPRGGSDILVPFGNQDVLISIHAPRGGSDKCDMMISQILKISIHAPRGGSDLNISMDALIMDISIHAPRGGSDRSEIDHERQVHNFNPRSPWGERLRVRLALFWQA